MRVRFTRGCLLAVLLLLGACAQAGSPAPRPTSDASATPSPPSPTPSAMPLRDGPTGTVYVSSGGSVYAFDAHDGTLRWRVATMGTALASIADFDLSVASGVVYVGANGSGESNGSILALRATGGSTLWRTTVHHIASSVAVQDGIAYVSCFTDGLIALNTVDGTVEWKSGYGGGGRAPAIGGGLAFLSGVSNLAALNVADGSRRWEYGFGDYTQGWLPSNPVVVGSAVYAATANGHIYAFNASDGHLLWQMQVTPGTRGLGPIAVSNGTIYGGADGHLFAIQASDGMQVRVSSFAGQQLGTPVLDGTTLYAHVDGGWLYALRPTDGSTLWRVQMGTGQTPLVAWLTVGSGVVFSGGYDGYVYALRASDGALEWRMQTNGVPSTPIYVG